MVMCGDVQYIETSTLQCGMFGLMIGRLSLVPDMSTFE